MKRSYLIVIALLIMVVATAVAQDATVRAKAQSTVRAATMTVGDIADVVCPDPELKERVKSIRLGVSPLPGSWRELERDMIAAQLRRSGYLPTQVKLVGPSTVKIYRESQRVQFAALEMRLRDFIYANASWNPEDMEITSISRVNELILPAGELSIDIRLRGSGQYLGRTPFTVSFIVDGKSVHQVVLQAQISVFNDAVIAVNTLATHKIIGVSDVEIRRIDISSNRGATFDSVNDVVGMATTTFVQSGKVITSRQITMPLLVKRGDAISLVALRPGFSIVTAGVAQQDGRKGELIRVMNPSSKKVVDAKVTGAGRAEVIF